MLVKYNTKRKDKGGCMRILFKVMAGISLSFLLMPLLQAEERKVPSQETQHLEKEAPVPILPSQAKEAAENKEYQQKLLQINNAITAKISEIEAKAREIDAEVYPASVPPLRSEKQSLETQLKDLEMQRDKLQTEKSSKDLTKSIEGK